MYQIMLNLVTIFSLLVGSNTAEFGIRHKQNVHSVDRLIFGTAGLGRLDNPMDILDAAYERGVRRFDLARTYGLGASERIFGEWLSSRDHVCRDELNIITKGGIGMDCYGDPNRPLLTFESLREEVELSLRTLTVESVDLYMFHRDDFRLDVADFVEWINILIREGKMKRWGVSNWCFARFQQAHDYALKNGLVPPTANSAQFSLAVPSCEIWPSTESISTPEQQHEIDWYRKNGVEVLGWEVLAKGFMAREDLWPQEEIDLQDLDCDMVERGTDEWRLRRIQKAYCTKDNYYRRDLAIQIARNSKLNLAQVAMLYTLSRSKNVGVIIGPLAHKEIDDMVALQHMNIGEDAMEHLIRGQEEPISQLGLVAP